MLEKGAISECKPEKNQFISPYFLRDKPDGSKRFILNLKNLNKFIRPNHFKMEDKKVVIALMGKNDFMTSIDLQDGFFHIRVDSRSKKYLRFVFQGKIYQFNCLPFGLNISPYVFTKILKPVASFLRSMGIKCVFYLDDILLIGKTKKQCTQITEFTQNILESVGFV